MTTRRPSLRAAIDAKCKSCIYDRGHGGTWREQVGECSSTNCPLHPVRPMPTTAKKAVSSPENAAPEPGGPDVAGGSGSALVGEALPRDGVAADR